jgi:uncharacterized protein YacL
LSLIINKYKESDIGIIVKNFLRTVIILTGAALGPALVTFVFQMINRYLQHDLSALLSFGTRLIIFFASGILTGAITFLFVGPIVDKIMGFTREAEHRVTRASFRTVVFGAIGLLLGLIVSFFLTWIFEKLNMPWLSVPLNVLIYSVVTYSSIVIAVKMSAKPQDLTVEQTGVVPKYLDTSVIIDGRIFDVLKTGIVDGPIVIPEFVLAELRHVADSEDPLRRAKGRRGLDILGKMQKELEIAVEITAENPAQISEVDAKLLHLAQQHQGKVITNDFNLNKVGVVQGVPIININELSNAIKPVVLPGEGFSVTIVREGREAAQGLAYLEDGTMIVVEDAKDKIDQTVDIVVTSALQTAAGRMIFARLA